MQIGMIGLGRMGGNIARRLMRHGHETIVYDRDAKAVAALVHGGAVRQFVDGAFGNLAGWQHDPDNAWFPELASEVVETCGGCPPRSIPVSARDKSTRSQKKSSRPMRKGFGDHVEPKAGYT